MTELEQRLQSLLALHSQILDKAKMIEEDIARLKEEIKEEEDAGSGGL